MIRLSVRGPRGRTHISITDPAKDRRHARGDVRRMALIQATRELLIERGYRETTLAQIIARAGGSRETIYRTLGGKSGIFRAIVAEAGEEVAESILDPAWFQLAPREGLTQLGLRLASIWLSSEGRAVHRVVLSEALESPEVVDAWYQGGSALTIAALAQYLQAQIDVGRLVPHEPELVARQFLTLLMGEFAFPAIAGSRHAVAVDVHIGRCVDLILAAIAVR